MSVCPDCRMDVLVHKTYGMCPAYVMPVWFSPSGNPATPIVPSERSEDATD